jgi:penicillin-binding protein 1A
MAAWDSGAGMVTDAFKPDQVPGASRPIGGVAAGSGGAPPDAPQTVHGGVDTSLGGIY